VMDGKEVKYNDFLPVVSNVKRRNVCGKF